MNRLDLDIKEVLNGTQKELWLNLKIDGEEFLKKMDRDLNAAVFEELEDSINGNDDYLIFTCACGIADCGGWKKVEVRHEIGKTIWTFEYDDEKFNFEFETEFYRGEIERMRFELNKSKLKLEPHFIVDPE